MAMYGSVDSQPGQRPTPRATRRVAFFLAGLALVAVVTIGMLASSDQSTELRQLRRGLTKNLMDRVNSLHVKMDRRNKLPQNPFRSTTIPALINNNNNKHPKVHHQAKLQHHATWPPMLTGAEEEHIEEAAHDLAQAGTEYSHEMDEIASACHQELTEFENAISTNDPELVHMTEEEMMIAHASYMIFKMMDKDESGCVDHHEYFDILDVIHKEDEHACFHDLELICGRHFNKGVLDKEGAAEDFDHIDSDGSGYLSINEVANLVYHVIKNGPGGGAGASGHDDHVSRDNHDHHGDHIHCANGRC